MRFFSFLGLVLVLAVPVAAMADTPVATISVRGEGRVEVEPDMATLSLGVTSEGKTASAALGANSDAVAAVLARLAAAGVEPRDIQTSGLSLGPRYDHGRSNNEPPKIVGYTASNMVTVRIRALDRAGNVLDTVVASGANTLNGLSFGLQDNQAALDEARRRAVADAARKAALYADAAGVTLGPVLSIHEPGAAQPPMPMVMAEASFARGGNVPVAAGELDIRAGVTIIYAIAD